MRLKENSIGLLKSETVDLQAGDGKSDVYAVPVGKNAIVTHTVIRNPTGSLAGGTDFDIGAGVGADSWKTGIDLSSLTETTDSIVIANNAKTTVLYPGDVFGIIPVTGATLDVQAVMDVFGYEF